MPTKVRLVKAMFFPVVMYGCESWTIKKAECQRIDAFELWCWRRLLRVPWTTRRCNQFILKEISPECSLEALILKLKLQYLATWCEELTHWKRLWCWETLRAGGEGDDRGLDGCMASLTQRTWVWVDSGSWWWTGRPGVLWFMGSQRVGHDWAPELNSYTITEEFWIFSLWLTLKMDYVWENTEIIWRRQLETKTRCIVSNISSINVSRKNEWIRGTIFLLRYMFKPKEE